MTTQNSKQPTLFSQEKSGGLWIPDKILYDSTLSPTAKLLAAQICAYGEKGCFRSNESLAAMAGVSVPTVKRELAALVKMGMVAISGHTSERLVSWINLSQDEKYSLDQNDPSKAPTRIKLSLNMDQFEPHNINTLKSNIKKREGGSKRFISPTLEQVKTYIQQNPKLSGIDPQGFIDYYEAMSPPWSDAKGNPVRSWKGKLQTWSHYGNSRKTSPKAHRTDFGKRESKYGDTIEV